MDPIAEARREYRAHRLYQALESAGSISLTEVTRKVIRDSDERREAIDALITAGKVRVEIIQAPSGRGRVHLVKAG